MTIFTKAELVSSVAEKTGTSKAAAERMITALQDTVVEAVAEGKQVKMPGFASFTPSVRSARVVRNPQTKEAISVPETKVVKIKPLGVFSEAVSKG